MLRAEGVLAHPSGSGSSATISLALPPLLPLLLLLPKPARNISS